MSEFNTIEKTTYFPYFAAETKKEMFEFNTFKEKAAYFPYFSAETEMLEFNTIEKTTIFFVFCC